MLPAAESSETRCYFSTPDHLRSLLGRLWIYEGKGQLTIKPEKVLLRRIDGFSMTIQHDAILHVSKGSFSRLAKPMGLGFIELSFADADEEHTLLITPTPSWSASDREKNKRVDEWLGRLRQLIRS